MHWFRSSRFEIVMLAFFALACQFALSFGHFHPQWSAGGSIGWATAGQGKAVAGHTGKLAVADLPTTPRQTPSGLGDDFCAVCASVSLAGALIVPLAPGLLANFPTFEALDWSLAASEARSIDRFHFNARGPPAA